MDLYAFGLRIRLLRRLRGLSQKELAGRAGVTPAHLAHLESGERSASLETLLRLCLALSARPDDLLRDSLPPDAAAQHLALDTLCQVLMEAAWQSES